MQSELNCYRNKLTLLDMCDQSIHTRKVNDTENRQISRELRLENYNLI